MLTRRRFALTSTFLGLAGCRRSQRRTIAVVPKAVSHMFFESVHAGAVQAGRDFDVNILWNGPNEETEHSRQIQIVDAMVVRRVDAMAISATDERALAAPVQRAIDAGIPVTVFDSGVNARGYVSFIATDNYGAGCTAARKIADLIGGSGEVAMVMHKPGGTSTVLREQGFEETIVKEFPRISIAARQYGMADRAKSRAAAENMLTARPRLAGMFASSEASSLGAIQAIQSRGLTGKVKLITFDFSESHVEALENGIIDIMLVQEPFRLGYDSVKSLVDKLNGKTPPERVDIPARVIVKSDLENPEIRKLLLPDWMKKRPAAV